MYIYIYLDFWYLSTSMAWKLFLISEDHLISDTSIHVGDFYFYWRRLSKLFLYFYNTGQYVICKTVRSLFLCDAQ